MTEAPTYEVIIIGEAMRVSAAMTLGRSLREVLVLDAGSPCNFASPVAHNLMGRDGHKPGDILEESKVQVLKYTSVTYRNAKVEAVSGEDGNFEVVTNQGETFTAKKILLATGVTDILPEIEGIGHCWGKTAIHCPYCHGFEIRGQKIGILSHGKAALNMALLMQQWSSNVTVLSNQHEDIGFDQRRILRENGIGHIETELEAVFHEDGNVKCVAFRDGTKEDFEALYLRPGIRQPGTLALDLGIEFDHHGFIITDHAQRTNMPGIFAAGDCCNSSRSIAMSIGQGNNAGMCMNHFLVVEKDREELITGNIEILK